MLQIHQQLQLLRLLQSVLQRKGEPSQRLLVIMDTVVVLHCSWLMAHQAVCMSRNRHRQATATRRPMESCSLCALCRYRCGIASFAWDYKTTGKLAPVSLLHIAVLDCVTLDDLNCGRLEYCRGLE